MALGQHKLPQSRTGLQAPNGPMSDRCKKPHGTLLSCISLLTFVYMALQLPALLDSHVVQEELTKDAVVGAIQHLCPARVQPCGIV